MVMGGCGVAMGRRGVVMGVEMGGCGVGMDECGVVTGFHPSPSSLSHSYLRQMTYAWDEGDRMVKVGVDE